MAERKEQEARDARETNRIGAAMEIGKSRPRQRGVQRGEEDKGDVDTGVEVHERLFGLWRT